MDGALRSPLDARRKRTSRHPPMKGVIPYENGMQRACEDKMTGGIHRLVSVVMCSNRPAWIGVGTPVATFAG